jgi:hypothetical protein
MSQESEEPKSRIRISSRNLKSGSEASKPRIDRLVEPVETTKSAYSVVQLESLLEEEKAQRRIERFFWIFGLTILFDCILFKFLDASFPESFIIALSIILLIGLAKWLEVPFVAIYLDRAFTRFMGRQRGKSEDLTEEK